MMAKAPKAPPSTASEAATDTASAVTDPKSAVGDVAQATVDPKTATLTAAEAMAAPEAAALAAASEEAADAASADGAGTASAAVDTVAHRDDERSAASAGFAAEQSVAISPRSIAEIEAAQVANTVVSDGPLGALIVDGSISAKGPRPDPVLVRRSGSIERFTVYDAVKLNGTLYAVGDEIDVTKDEHGALHKAGVIYDPWPED